MEAIGDEPAKEIVLNSIFHTCAVTNEALSVLSALQKPPTGFSKLKFDFWKTLGERVSPTVIDQFAQHCHNLQTLHVSGQELRTEEDRVNLCDLASRMLDVQVEDQMDSLTMIYFANK